MEKIRKKSSGKRAGSVSLWLILCLACLLLLGGCRKKEEVHPTAGEDGVYQIYYLNSTRTGLASVSYQTETTDRGVGGADPCGAGKPGVSGSFKR